MNYRLTFMFLYFTTIQSSAQQFYVQKYTVKDGLAGNDIQTILKDSRGFLWISTNDGGLSRYDGKHFTNYSMEEGLSSYIKWVSFEDSIGRLWFSNKFGVCSFDGKKFEQFPVENSPPNLWINQVLQTKNKQFWFVTLDGIFQLEGSIWRKTNILQTNPHNHFVSLVQLNDGSFIVSLYDSLVHWWSSSNYKTIARSNSENPIFLSITKSKSKVWVNTYSHLYLLNNDSLVPVHDDLLAHKNIFSVYEDLAGRLWVGTANNGIQVFSEDKVVNIALPALKKETRINDFLEDNEGNIWACASDGLLKIKPAFISFTVTAGIKCSLKDHNGNIIFGGNHNTLWSIDNKGVIKADHSIDNISSRHDLYIICMEEDNLGRIWIADNLGNLFRKSKDKIENISGKLNLEHAVDAMLFSSSEHCMYATGAMGLIKINADDSYTIDTLITQHERRISVLSLDSFGNVWLAGARGEMMIKNNSGYHQVNDLLGIHQTIIRNIFFRTKNCLWITSWGKGVYFFIRNANNEWELNLHLTTADGLPSDFVHDVSFDNMNRLWITTLSGLCSVEFSNSFAKNFSVRKYGDDEGFYRMDDPYSNLITDARGNIWFGSGMSLAKIRPGEIMEDTLPPQIYIEDVRLFNSNTNWIKYTKSFNSFFGTPVDPELPYKENDLTILYNAISFTNEKNIEYSYRLKGTDKEWMTAENNEPVTYANLSPGKYFFEVRAKKTFSVWSNPVSFSFMITPPWWKTWWFRSLLFAAIVSIVYSLYRFRLQQMLKLLSIRNKIAGDLHDDIGSTLNSISVYSEVAKKKNEQHDEVLEMIGDSSRKVIDSMSDIVWTINPDNDSFEKIIFRMKSLAYNLFRSKKIEFIFQADEDLNSKKLSLEDRRNFYLIFKEAINNLVKYSQAKTAGISLMNENNLVTLRIKDDGVGFDTTKDISGNGLKNMKRRASEMKAQFRITSVEGQGSEIELILKA